MKKHNFNAGPSILADEVIENAAKAILDFNGSGLSLLSISQFAVWSAMKIVRKILEIRIIKRHIVYIMTQMVMERLKPFVLDMQR